MRPPRLRLAALLAVLALSATLTACGAQPPEQQAQVARAADPDFECGGIDKVDASALRALLEAADYAALEERLHVYQSAYEADPSCEPSLWVAYDALEAPSDARLAALDRWVAARPQSYAAHSLRGGSRVSLGYQQRGGSWAKDTDPEKFRAMREVFAVAEHDLLHAIELHPRHVVARGRLIVMWKATGDQGRSRGQLDQLLAVDPHNYGVRRRMVESLSPKWGGSLGAMREIAEAAQKYAGENPRLPVLLGFPFAVEAEAAVRKKELAAGLRGYTKALDYGEFFRWRKARADLYYRSDRFTDCVADATRILERYPDEKGALVLRAKARKRLGDTDAALADLNQALEAAPGDAYAHRTRGWVHEARRDWPAAADDYQASLAATPDNTWTLRKAGRVLADRLGRLDEAEPLYRRLTELSPEEARAWFDHAEVLHRLGRRESKERLAHYLTIAEPKDRWERQRIDWAEDRLGITGAARAPVPADTPLPGLARLERPTDG